MASHINAVNTTGEGIFSPGMRQVYLARCEFLKCESGKNKSANNSKFLIE